MKKYIVTYDLNKKDKDYNGLINAIKQYNCIKLLYSAWIIKSNQSAQQIFDALRPYIDANDGIIVIEINTLNEQGWLPNDKWNFING